MAFGTITSTSNTFGSVDGTATGVVPGTLSGSVGVPGPQGPAGATGAQGPAGAAGVGVPAGGTAGQFLTKIDGTNYNTDWTTVNLSAYVLKANNLSDLTNVTTARSNLGLGPTVAQVFGGVSGSIGSPGAEGTNYTYNASFTGFSSTEETYVFPGEGEGPNWLSDSKVASFSKSGFGIVNSTYGQYGDLISYSGLTYGVSDCVLTFDKTNTGTLSISASGITFPNASVQTIAFPGFTGYAPLASPAFTGNPTAPTAALGDNDTSIATTAFVQQELLSGTANARNLEVYVRNQTGSTIPAGSIVYINGATGNRPTITLAQANNDANSAQTIGFTKTAIANNGFGFVIVRGELENINTSALTEGVQLYLSPTTAGTWTTTKPSAPQHLVYVGVVIRSHPTLGTILVAVQNGYELGETHDVALASLANNDLLVYELSTDLWKNKSFSTLGLATLASPTFTGTPSLPTGTTAVTQTAGDNTTALATTAFVTTSNPDASTTVKGHVELATNAEAQLGSSDTLAMSPSAVQYARLATTFFRMSALVAVGATSGTGSAASTLLSGYNSRSPTTAVGYGILSFAIVYHSRGSGSSSSTPLPWNKRFVAQFRFHPRTLGTDANTINRVLFGKTGTAVAGELTQRGVGVRQIANGALELVVHNGTTFTAVTSSYTPAVNSSTDIRIVSDGAGNVTLFNNDSQIATTSAGPSTAGTTNNTYLTVESENLATITGTNNTLYTAEMSFEFAQ